MYPPIICFGASRVVNFLLTLCKDCFRHPARLIDNCWVISTKVQNALPLCECRDGSRGDQLQREMAGFVTVCVESFKFMSLAA
jgi:hypothetical protein